MYSSSKTQSQNHAILYICSFFSSSYWIVIRFCTEVKIAFNLGVSVLIYSICRYFTAIRSKTSCTQFQYTHTHAWIYSVAPCIIHDFKLVLIWIRGIDNVIGFAVWMLSYSFWERSCFVAINFGASRINRPKLFMDFIKHPIMC